jgi:peptide/nickel transport system ATP-binding protein
MAYIKTTKAKTIEILERVGLGAEYFNRYPHEFSGRTKTTN